MGERYEAECPEILWGRGREYEPLKTDYWSSGTIRALFLTVIYMYVQQIEILSLDVA